MALPSGQLTFAEVRTRLRAHRLQLTEVPVEHYLSLPLPTRRLGPAGYASFAGPVRRAPDGSVRQGAPDRWWVVEAVSGRFLLYTLYAAHPFGPEAGWETVGLPPTGLTVTDLRQALREVEERIDGLATAFFSGAPGDAGQRQALLAALRKQVSAPLLPQYRALAPDFFAWLEG